MLYAIFADIHSNLEAYESFLKDAKEEGIQEYFCVGDIVGYGANPHECIELTKNLNCPSVCGNHDWACADKIDINYFNKYAKEAVIWTRDYLDDIDKNYLSNLKLTYQRSELTLVHSSLDYPQDFDYIFDTSKAAKTIELQPTPLCFVGHSHSAEIFFEGKGGYVQYTSIPEIRMQSGKKYLVNVGSIGQPRDGNWRSSYCIYDNEKDIIRLKRIEYDVRKARDKILKTGLPHYLADRILEGR